MFSLCSRETNLSKRIYETFKNNETSISVLNQIKKDHLKPSADTEFFTKEFTKINKNFLSLKQIKTDYSGHKTYQ